MRTLQERMATAQQEMEALRAARNDVVEKLQSLQNALGNIDQQRLAMSGALDVLGQLLAEQQEAAKKAGGPLRLVPGKADGEKAT